VTCGPCIQQGPPTVWRAPGIGYGQVQTTTSGCSPPGAGFAGAVVSFFSIGLPGVPSLASHISLSPGSASNSTVAEAEPMAVVRCAR
jgi:hypothetical protein